MAERFLILAPRGRDAQVIQKVVRGIAESVVYPDLLALLHDLRKDAAGIIVTEEALTGPNLADLLRWCEQQPPWSDLPLIVLATRQTGPRPQGAAAILERLGNVVLMERPVNSETLASAARSALRVRRRQYQAQSLLLEREQSEQKLRELNGSLERRVEERTRDLDRAYEALDFALESAGMGSWDLNLLTDTSRRTAQHDRIFGYAKPLRSWGQQTFLDHVLEEERSAVKEAFATAAARGTLDIECRIRRVDGAIRWIVAKGRARYGADGQLVRMAGVVMDTTDRRLTEDALRQAQKMEAIGQLTGGVAHDFNNLLTVVVGALDLVLRSPGQADRVARFAGVAMTAARRGERLTQQLLAFSRRQVLRPQTVNPSSVLTEFEALAQRAAGDAVTLHFDLAADVALVRVDPAQFEAAVLNLVVNARDAMPEGGTITIRSRNVRPPNKLLEECGLMDGAYVVISVSDSGSGIDPQVLLHVFEPFFTTKEVGKGSGLGLSQVYGFTRSAGGDVSVQSQLGQGTTISLFLPQASDQSAHAEHAALQSVAAPNLATGETVLLVEDDEQVLAVAIESLQELCYEVIVARNAREALCEIQTPRRIDVMFSDVVMPGGMSGAQLALEAKRLRPELKVLLTSGYIGDSATYKPIDAETEILTKPYRRDELAHKLRAVLDETRVFPS